MLTALVFVTNVCAFGAVLLVGFGKPAPKAIRRHLATSAGLWALAILGSQILARSISYGPFDGPNAAFGGIIAAGVGVIIVQARHLRRPAQEKLQDPRVSD